MTNSNPLPTVALLKDQAKRLRAGLSDSGTEIGHGRALELVARQHGYRDWNTLHAAADAPPPVGLSVGQRVQGRYLGKPFAAEIRGLQRLSKVGWHKVSLQFEAPVDVAGIADDAGPAPPGRGDRRPPRPNGRKNLRRPAPSGASDRWMKPDPRRRDPAPSGQRHHPARPIHHQTPHS